MLSSLIVISSILGMMQPDFDFRAGHVTGSYTHIFTGAALLFAAAFFKEEQRHRCICGTVLPFLFCALASQRLFEIVIPTWPDFFQNPSVIDFLAALGFRGQVSMESTLSILFISGYQLSYRRSEFSQFAFVVALLVVILLGWYGHLYNTVIWDTHLSLFSLIGFTFVTIKLLKSLSNQEIGYSPENPLLFLLKGTVPVVIITALITKFFYLSVLDAKPIDEVNIKLYLASIGWIIGLTLFLLGLRFERKHSFFTNKSQEDYLTKTLNRRGLENTLKSLSTEQGLILLDVDRFKLVNDTYGHLVGDEVLRKLAETINQRLPRNASFGRWGGEEFLIVIETGNQIHLQRFAEEIRAAIEADPITLGSASGEHAGAIIAVTASLGCTIFTPSEETTSQALSRTDKALYLAKDHGRNRVELSESVKIIDMAEKRANAVKRSLA